MYLMTMTTTTKPATAIQRKTAREMAELFSVHEQPVEDFLASVNTALEHRLITNEQARRLLRLAGF